MALKIMSGIVLSSKQNGYVKVMFGDNSIQNSSWMRKNMNNENIT